MVRIGGCAEVRMKSEIVQRIAPAGSSEPAVEALMVGLDLF
jgi:hypothetical protein